MAKCYVYVISHVLLNMGGDLVRGGLSSILLINIERFTVYLYISQVCNSYVHKKSGLGTYVRARRTTRESSSWCVVCNARSQPSMARYMACARSR